MRKVLISSAVALMVAAAAGGAAAQSKGQQGVDTRAPATYGDIRLNSGFTPDPYRVDIFSGGSINATTVADGCVGLVARAPDFRVTYSAGALPLIFGVTSDFDTTLVINGPDGRWFCDDDSGDGTNPLMSIPNPQSGVYDVYVGAYGGNSGQSQLYITELSGNALGDSSGSTRSGGVVDPFEAANYGRIELSSGFTPDPQVISIRAGGTINAQNVSSQCRGFITRAPDVELSYSAGSLPLILSVDSNSDTTLVVNGPDGSWSCDDDGGERGSNPALRFNSPMSGTYDIWVGTYSTGNSQPASLNISELYSQ